MASTGEHAEFIGKLDHKSNSDRFDLIVSRLQSMKVHYEIHHYSTGKNIIVDLEDGKERIAVSSHFDKVEGSGGANDNGSAVAVCLSIIERFINSPSKPPLRIFFFDEEENNLRGSTAYVAKWRKRYPCIICNP